MPFRHELLQAHFSRAAVKTRSMSVAKAGECDGEVHVATGWLEQCGVKDFACLTSSEAERLGRYRQEADQRRFALGRSLSKLLLSNLCGLEPSSVEIAYRCNRCGPGDHGKPYAIVGDMEWHLSISHSQELVVVAVSSSHAVGVDVEYVDPQRYSTDILNLVESGAEFSARERSCESFTQLWVQKEAALKCSGEGLIRAMSDLTVVTQANEARVSSLTPCYSTIRVRTLDLSAAYRCAIATEGIFSVCEIRLDHAD